ncbi:MAG TPA: thioredoxin family protein [Candidatus Binatia bacterium]|nr:thioredoxin family protein [Candidatus Binatia bacterium]
MRRLRTGTIVLAAAMLMLAATTRVRAGGDWNDGGIGWQGYEAGLAKAKKEKKPVCLIFYTEWCPHCSNYSKLFHDEKVVDKSKKFVMIRLDKDKNGEISKKYTPDGEYIPRTYFLSSDGKLDPDLHENRDKWLYFYNERSADGILGGMDRALAKLK